MASRVYPAVFATETPYVGQHMHFDKELDRYVWRSFKMSMNVTPQTMFANRLNTPAGIQVLWAHGRGGGYGKVKPAIGRVLDMRFVGKRLLGNIELDEVELTDVLKSGFAGIERGVNNGISITLAHLDEPFATVELRDGTFDNPDIMKYRRTQITEASLTPIPRIMDCGLIIKRK